MKKLILLLALAIAGAAANAADTPGALKGDRWVPCDAHSLVIVMVAAKAVREKRPVDAVLHESYAHPQDIDVKLSRLAYDMLAHGIHKDRGYDYLRGFLAGACYGHDE